MKAALTHIGLLLGLVIQLSACGSGGGLLPAPPDVEPPTALAESALTTGDKDDLYPQVEGDHMVCMRANPQVSEDGVLADCLNCPNCQDCHWDIVHVNLVTRKQTIVETVTHLLSSPRLSEGRVYWLASEGNERYVRIQDLSTGKHHDFTPQQDTWFNEVPTLRGDYVYWHGYLGGNYTNGLIRANIYTGAGHKVFDSSFRDTDYMQQGQLERMAESQPFVIQGDLVYWVSTKGPGRSVRRWNLLTKQETVLEQKSSVEMYALAAGTDFAVWKERRAGSCWNSGDCEIGLQAYIPGVGSIDVTPENALISRYADLVVSGDIVFWADYREGPYALFGLDVFNVSQSELRYTSEKAVIGSWTTPVANETDLVWMDGRGDNWAIYSRPL